MVGLFYKIECKIIIKNGVDMDRQNNGRHGLGKKIQTCEGKGTLHGSC